MFPIFLVWSVRHTLSQRLEGKAAPHSQVQQGNAGPPKVLSPPPSLLHRASCWLPSLSSSSVAAVSPWYRGSHSLHSLPTCMPCLWLATLARRRCFGGSEGMSMAVAVVVGKRGVASSKPTQGPGTFSMDCCRSGKRQLRNTGVGSGHQLGSHQMFIDYNSYPPHPAWPMVRVDGDCGP